MPHPATKPEQSRITAAKPSLPQETHSSWRVILFQTAFLFLAALLIYWPSYHAGTLWDDETMAASDLIKNSWPGLRDIWFSRKFIDYVPLTSTTFWMEWQIWGRADATQHGVNIFLHALSVVLLWRVLRRLMPGGSQYSTAISRIFSPAWLTALLFAVHPVCVLSVTWLAERKNTLSMVFYLLSLLFYFRSEELSNSSPQKRSVSFYWLSLLAFLLALFSKTSVVILPAALVLCAWWQRGRIGSRDIRRLIPFFALAAIFTVSTILVHHQPSVKTVVLSSDNLLVRSLGATQAVWFYIWKTLVPVNLTMIYPRWEIHPASMLAWIAGPALLTLFGLFWRFRQTWGRACLFGIGYFALALSPVLGVVNMIFLHFSRVADHFQYLAMPGLLALLVGGSFWIASHVLSGHFNVFTIRKAGFSFGFCALVVLSFLSWRHQKIVANPEAMWIANLAIYPKSWVAHNNLCEIYLNQNDFKKAEEHCRASMAIDSRMAEPYYNLGEILRRQDKLAEALEKFTKAAEMSPYDFRTRNNIAGIFIQQGRLDEALEMLREVIRLDPDSIRGHENLAEVFLRKNQPYDAIEQFRKLTRIRPQDFRYHLHLARSLFGERKLDEALAEYDEVLRLGNRTAEIFFEKGMLLGQQGKTAPALQSLQAALALDPDSIAILNNVAWILATSSDPLIRDGSESVRLAKHASALAGTNDFSVLDTFAAAHAEAGTFPEAVSAMENGIALAEIAKDTNTVAKFQGRLELYRQQKPYRAP